MMAADPGLASDLIKTYESPDNQQTKRSNNVLFTSLLFVGLFVVGLLCGVIIVTSVSGKSEPQKVLQVLSTTKAGGDTSE